MTIRDQWDQGSPQRPSGFATWGADLSDEVDALSPFRTQRSGLNSLVTPAIVWATNGTFVTGSGDNTLAPHVAMTATSIRRMKLYFQLPEEWPAYQVGLHFMRTATGGETAATWSYRDRQHGVGVNNNAATTQHWSVSRNVPGSTVGAPDHYVNPTVVPIGTDFFGKTAQIMGVVERAAVATTINVGVINVTFLRAELP